MVKALVSIALTAPWILGGVSLVSTNDEPAPRTFIMQPESLPTTTVPTATTGTPAEYAALEQCQYAYLHHQSTAAEYLICTHGLHADESRTTNYAWMR